MLQYYQEITIIPSPEISINAIWSKVFEQIHIALVKAMHGEEKGKIGIAFPAYRDDEVVTLGNKLRLFADEDAILNELNLKFILRRYIDYLHITNIRVVPEKIRGYETYKRVHREGNQANKARRYAKRHQVPLAEAMKMFPKDCWGHELPYIQLTSHTNQHRYRLYIKKCMREKEEDYGFSSYGVDNQSSVPSF